jgi:hypothetical protein
MYIVAEAVLVDKRGDKVCDERVCLLGPIDESGTLGQVMLCSPKPQCMRS